MDLSKDSNGGDDDEGKARNVIGRDRDNVHEKGPGNCS
jgi:hypothetical protein